MVKAVSHRNVRDKMYAACDEMCVACDEMYAVCNEMHAVCAAAEIRQSGQKETRRKR